MMGHATTQWSRAVLGAILLGLAGCDFSVTNPGPVADTFLDDEGAHEAILFGASYMISEALWKYGIAGAETTYEVTRSGRNFSGAGVKMPPQVGHLVNDQIGAGYWNAPQQARWVAEDASRRFEEVLGADAASYALNAQAKLIAGHANRLLGENQCVAVVDGSGVEPNEVWWQRAEAAFRDAIQIGQQAGRPDIVLAARAGLAQVLGPGLGKWAEAVSFAEQIPEDFTYQAVHSRTSVDQYNHVVYISDGDAWRDLTSWNTFVVDYYNDTGDPRVRWEDTGRSDTPNDLVLWRQRKFTELDDPVNLSSGREMVLIRAEALLRSGDWQGAVDLINDLRSTVISDHTGAPIPSVSAGSLEEAWTRLKEERRIELWLEGRRMFDLRRWIADNSPGEMEDMSSRLRLCFPVAEVEIRNNPNIPKDYEDPVNPLYSG